MNYNLISKGSILVANNGIAPSEAAHAIENQVLVQSLVVQTLIIFSMGALIYIFVFRMSRRQADEITLPLREFERMVGKRTEQLENKNRELQEFARIASHDLQEPLRKIRTFGDRLKAKPTGTFDEQSFDYIARMISAAARMQSLIDGLLAYSLVTNKGNPFAHTDLGVIVKEVISDLEIRIGETGGRVDVGDMASLDADELQMRQLLQNLIGNGLKYHKKNVPPVIKVFNRIIERKDGPMVEIVVEDNGIGISEEHFDKIFMVFQRLHSRGSEYEGSGIGLSVVKKIVERHEGTVKVESVVGEWTRFIVSLPLYHQQRESLSHI
jgi:light-regulated signal transduction histidine kinase (bacteriophytochrome)